MYDLDWQKMNGLIPAVIQHANNGQVLMLGYMNAEALAVTMDTNTVTFYSRSKARLWTKGETSGDFLRVISITQDCDGDSLLIQVIPEGSACHLGTKSCFHSAKNSKLQCIDDLMNTIQSRAKSPSLDSYTSQLLKQGVARCAQKVGEEAVETAIAAVLQNKSDLIGEASDLFFHLLVLLQACELDFYSLIDHLEQRQHKKLEKEAIP